jgi:hypothetical protein
MRQVFKLSLHVSNLSALDNRSHPSHFNVQALLAHGFATGGGIHPIKMTDIQYILKFNFGT